MGHIGGLGASSGLQHLSGIGHGLGASIVREMRSNSYQVTEPIEELD